MFLWSLTTFRRRLVLVTFLLKVSRDMNKPIENHQVGQNSDDNKTEVGLPGDCSNHYQEESYIT